MIDDLRTACPVSTRNRPLPTTEPGTAGAVQALAGHAGSNFPTITGSAETDTVLRLFLLGLMTSMRPKISKLNIIYKYFILSSVRPAIGENRSRSTLRSRAAGKYRWWDGTSSRDRTKRRHRPYSSRGDRPIAVWCFPSVTLGDTGLAERSARGLRSGDRIHRTISLCYILVLSYEILSKTAGQVRMGNRSCGKVPQFRRRECVEEVVPLRPATPCHVDAQLDVVVVGGRVSIGVHCDHRPCVDDLFD